MSQVAGNSAGSIFKGSMPEFYDRYLGPYVFKPYAADIAGRFSNLRTGRLLETAAGTGIVTAALARAVSAAIEIVATDLSPEMISYAAKETTYPNVTFREANAQALPFEDASFDAMACQFGVMFFPDKSQAYREAHRVLKPGGRFVFNVWNGLENNDLPRTGAQALAELFPHDPPSFMRRVPYGYHDVPAIEHALRDAGFARSSVEVVNKLIRIPSARDYAIGSCQGGPARAEIEARDAGQLERASDAVTLACEKRFGSGPIEAKSQALVFTAWR